MSGRSWTGHITAKNALSYTYVIWGRIFRAFVALTAGHLVEYRRACMHGSRVFGVAEGFAKRKVTGGHRVVEVITRVNNLTGKDDKRRTSIQLCLPTMQTGEHSHFN